MAFEFKDVEKKWQDNWKQSGIFDVNPNEMEDKYYILVMFPYPSGDRLHMGHWYQYGLMDSWARYQRLQGKQVYFPMGFDAFGLPAENYAIKHGVHPDISTTKNVNYMKEQFQKMGVSYHFDGNVDTSKPSYYKWTQWVFSTLYKNGLAQKKEAPVNWCLSCQTVLANEQVQEGECERCGSEVEQRNLSQWFFQITKYADRLLNNLESLDWPSKTVAMQNNWIGKSTGAQIQFAIKGHEKSFEVFTTRPDTLFGVTYVTFAPEHPMVLEFTTDEQRAAVEEYIEKTKKMKEVDRLSTAKEKTGVFTGAYAINPVNGEEVPVWIGDYVLYSYGTGAVMAVPGHDERDFAFAKEFGLEIRKVILQEGEAQEAVLEEAWTGSGSMVNSGSYDGISSDVMKEKIVEDLSQSGKAEKKINFRLRDWLVSRQRYWGAPIPIINCEDCGEVLVPEKDLPVVLPDDVEFKPTGESPLKSCPEFYKAPCPKCGKEGTREVDTLDTFVCSSWYYLRYPDAHNDKEPFGKDITFKMLPVDKYVGGPEHACMHLLYARFINMALYDLGYVPSEEPFTSLTHQGMILGPDGAKMSKSKGNTVSPDEYVEQYGSDILRLYLAFGFNYVEGGPWSDEGFKSASRFGDRVARLLEERSEFLAGSFEKPESFSSEEKKLLFVLHNSIKGVTQDTERFMFNTSIARIMELYNATSEYLRSCEDSINSYVMQQVLENILRLLSPFMPHFCEEFWSKNHESSIFEESWPEYEESFLVLDEVSMAVMINGKKRDEISVANNAGEEEVFAIACESSRVSKYLEGMQVVKKIFVKGKLINLILKPA